MELCPWARWPRMAEHAIHPPVDLAIDPRRADPFARGGGQGHSSPRGRPSRPQCRRTCCIGSRIAERERSRLDAEQAEAVGKACCWSRRTTASACELDQSLPGDRFLRVAEDRALIKLTYARESSQSP